MDKVTKSFWGWEPEDGGWKLKLFKLFFKPQKPQKIEMLYLKLIFTLEKKNT